MGSLFWTTYIQAKDLQKYPCNYINTHISSLKLLESSSFSKFECVGGFLSLVYLKYIFTSNFFNSPLSKKPIFSSISIQLFHWLSATIVVAKLHSSIFKIEKSPIIKQELVQKWVHLILYKLKTLVLKSSLMFQCKH